MRNAIDCSVRPVVFLMTALALLSVTGVAAVAQDKIIAVTELFPLKKGAAWEMRVTEPDAKASSERMEIVGTQIVGQDLCYELKRTAQGGSVSGHLAGSEILYLTVKEQGLFLSGERYKVDSDLSKRDGWCILKPGLAQMQRWRYDLVFRLEKKLTLDPEFDELWASPVFRYDYLQYPEEIEFDGKPVSVQTVFRKERRIGEKVIKKKNGTVVFDQVVEGRPDPPVFVEVQSYQQGKGLVRSESYKLDEETEKKSGESSLLLVTATTGLGAYEFGKILVNVDETDSDTPVAVDKYRLEPGDEATFKFSRTISQEASFVVKDSSGKELGGNVGLDLSVLKVEASGRIKSAVETAVGQKLTTEETRERTITVRNRTDRIREGKIVWVDTYKTGSLPIRVNDVSYQLDFRFPVGTRLESRNNQP